MNPFLLGYALSHRSFFLRELIGLCIIAAEVHVFGYVLNDAGDYHRDMRDCRRARRPLVSGAVSRREAIPCAVLAAVTSVLFCALFYRKHSATVTLILLLLAIAAYDLWGKRTSVPIIMDFIIGIGAGVSAFVGALVSGGSVTSTVVCFAAYYILVIAFVNGVHGALRDISADRECAAVTTAIKLKVDVIHGDLHLHRQMRWYIALLQTFAALLAILLSMSVASARDATTRLAVLSVALWLIGMSSLCLFRAVEYLATDHRRASVWATLHMLTILTTPTILCWPQLRVSGVIGVLTLTLGPLLLHQWYRQSVGVMLLRRGHAALSLFLGGACIAE